MRNYLDTNAITTDAINKCGVVLFLLYRMVDMLPGVCVYVCVFQVRTHNIVLFIKRAYGAKNAVHLACARNSFAYAGWQAGSQAASTKHVANMSA